MNRITKIIKSRMNLANAGVRLIQRSALFDAAWYIEENPDVRDAGMPPLQHYLLAGWRERRRPHPLFDIDWYLEQNSDVREAGVEPLEHYLSSGWKEHRQPHPLFDSAWYLAQYADVKKAQLEPLEHYLTIGWRELRQPHPLFDSAWYVEQNPDVRSAGIDPLRHYLRVGWKKLRQPNALFDSAWYLEQNPDVQAAQVDPLRHYLAFGWKEFRRPNPLFDIAWYLEQNPDVKFAGVEPLTHYLTMGKTTGAKTLSPAEELYLIDEPGGFKLPDLSWYTAEKPLLSIIILNWNHNRITSKCLQKIWLHTAGYPYEIIVVDNGSASSDFAKLSKASGPFNLIRLNVNRFFGEANNIGVEAAKGQYVCFMNNDVFVHEGWLQPLMATLLEDERIGGVGPKFIYPNGILQEAGVLLDRDGIANQLGKGGDPSDPLFNKKREVDYISAATFIMRHRDFSQILGFDLMYEPAYYEDADLGLKIALLGKKIVYCPDSVVTHIENATSASKNNGLKLNRIMGINQTKFMARWGSYLAKDRSASPSLFSLNIDSNRTRYKSAESGNKKTVALFTPYQLTPGGGERYLLTIAETLSLAGMDVVLVTTDMYSRIRLLTIGRELGLALNEVRLTTLSELHTVGTPDISIAMGNEILPPVQPLGRKNIYICQFPFPIDPSEIARRWSYLQGYDAVLSYSKFARDNIEFRFSSLALTPPPTVIVSPPVDILSSADVKKPMILHVGRFFSGGHCKRQDELVNAFRQLYEIDNVDAELHLAGSIHPEAEHREYYLLVQRLADGLPVYFHPNVSREELAHLYSEARVYWHATGFGTDVNRNPEKQEHFGISVVEAMSAECIPIVYAQAGPTEIVQHGENGFHFHDLTELCRYTKPLIAAPNGSEAKELGKMSARRAQLYNKDSFSRLISDHVNRLLS